MAVIDGSNVIYWKPDACTLEPVKDVIRQLRRAGYKPHVIFDANAGHLVADRYLDGGAFAKRLGLTEHSAYVVPRGQSADPYILRLAEEQAAIVVSRDKFRQWAAQFPAATQPDRLVSGGYDEGGFWLDLSRLRRK